MPRKKNFITDEERAKRLREAGRDVGTTRKDFERAFKKIVPVKRARHSDQAPKTRAK